MYTSSALAVSLVGLFVDMQVRGGHRHHGCSPAPTPPWLTLTTACCGRAQRYDLTHPANASGRSKTSSDYQPPIPFKLPNLAAGMLTRESVHRALRKGITAEQVHGSRAAVL